MFSIPYMHMLCYTLYVVPVDQARKISICGARLRKAIIDTEYTTDTTQIQFLLQ